MNFNKVLLPGYVALISSLLVTGCNQSNSELSTSYTESVSTPAEDSTTASNKTPSVEVFSSDQRIYKGDSFTVDIMTKDFTPSEGGGLTLRFDPSILQVKSIDINETIWSFVNKDGQVNNVQGIVTDLLFSSYQGVNGDEKIATIEFQSIKTGTSSFTLEPSETNPFASNGQEMSVTYKPTTLSIY